ncbi:MAG: c-type cytochrome, partial [Thermoanaerobaculia bacterium]
TGAGGADTLEAKLLREDPGALAREARERGDPVRGAILFHAPNLSCARCHAPEEGGPRLGPDLADPPERPADHHLIESLLLPSKAIRKGFESVFLRERSGTTVTGLLAEESADAVVLRDLGRDFQPVAVPKSRIAERAALAVSIMPEGLVNQLAGREEFLHLSRYLMEIAERGPERARELRPAPYQLPPPLPEYESEIDHAGLIAGLDGESLKRGEAIYERLCANCHGTKDRLGSLPTSPRFASAAFKNGSDPHSLYRTLTRGFGLMAAQSWMVPRQKYDVIHYLREVYLKAENPSQYARVDARYLEGLPKGASRGPEPLAVEPWSAMDYGPSLMATIEAGEDGSGLAAKGIAVRLDGGPGGVARGRAFLLYDHDTLGAACAWSGEGFIDWNGINFN